MNIGSERRRSGRSIACLSIRDFERGLGAAMDDFSVLMLYVAADQYFKAKGKLGFVITQSIFKTEGGGEGFRRLQLGDAEHLQV